MISFFSLRLSSFLFPFDDLSACESNPTPLSILYRRNTPSKCVKGSLLNFFFREASNVEKNINAVINDFAVV
ncbi:MAG: hypothetical protein ACUVRP_12355, partial [Chlorobiales bacterium]